MPDIRDAAPADAEAIASIYNHYILDGVATFEETPIDAAGIVRRMEGVLSQGLWWLVATEADEPIGYAYAKPWHERAAYRHTVEFAIYLRPNAVGGGVGTALYAEMIERARAKGLHAAIGGVTLPNPASVALHEKFGFAKAAHYHQIGHKFGRWLDVGYWQLLLDEREKGPEA